MTSKTDKWIRFLKILLIVGSVLAAVKVIFVDYTMDEEYQVVMSYRMLTGDTMFGTMWEPHQTSAFLCVWLMRLFYAVTGTFTGVVVYLRVCTTVIQLLLSLWLYRTLARLFEKEYAFLMGACYFNIVPKMIQIPEFSNLQVWFFTVAVLALAEYYTEGKNGGRPLWLVVAGGGMALDVLAYPGSLLLFPFFLAVFLWKAKASDGSVRGGARNCLIFAGTCAACAAVWLWRVLSHVSPEEFLRNVRYVVEFDPTHDMSPDAEFRKVALLRDFKTLAVLLLISLVVALAVWWIVGKTRKRRDPDARMPRGAVFAVCAILAAEAVQIFYWLVIRAGYEITQIHLIVAMLAAAFLWRSADGRKGVLGIGMLGSAISIFVVVYMSDLGLWYAVPHGMLGVPFALAVLALALEKQGGSARFWTWLLLFSMAFISVFGKGFVLRAGRTETNTIVGIRGVIRHGPAVGIFTNYMQGYITNSTYEEFEEYVEPGSSCLVVSNLIGTAGTTPYLFHGGMRICHFSVVDPTTYDERLLTYWELYPEKRPDVIVVDCWYGQLMEAEDSWIMRYIEDEFGYTEAVDGKYVRYYFRH